MRGDESGFTLIELLVALSIFSLAVMALLNLAGENTRAAGAAATRVMAGVVAENQAVQAMTTPAPLALGASAGAEAQAGRLWRWTRQVTPTTTPGLVRIDVAVTPDGAMRPAARLTLFRSRS